MVISRKTFIFALVSDEAANFRTKVKIRRKYTFDIPSIIFYFVLFFVCMQNKQLKTVQTENKSDGQKDG